jgi:hypothetical protein
MISTWGIVCSSCCLRLFTHRAGHCICSHSWLPRCSRLRASSHRPLTMPAIGSQRTPAASGMDHRCLCAHHAAARRSARCLVRNPPRRCRYRWPRARCATCMSVLTRMPVMSKSTTKCALKHGHRVQDPQGYSTPGVHTAQNSERAFCSQP